MSITIWHNPRCSKSRQTVALLEERGVAAEIRLYLKDPPNAGEIEAVLGKLNIAPIALMRKAETVFRDMGLSADMPDATLIAAMAENPILIERPVVITETAAAIGRPPEAVLALF